MRCPCGGETYVRDARQRRGGFYRRRECATCGERFSTMEQIKTPKQKPAPKRKPGPHDPKRHYYRRQARLEAARTGEDVNKVYERWGVS